MLLGSQRVGHDGATAQQHDSKQNDIPTGARTVPRLTIKGQKVGSGPIPGNLPPFPKIVGIIFPSLAHEITQPIKANRTMF